MKRHPSRTEVPMNRFFVRFKKQTEKILFETTSKLIRIVNRFHQKLLWNRFLSFRKLCDNFAVCSHCFHQDPANAWMPILLKIQHPPRKIFQANLCRLNMHLAIKQRESWHDLSNNMASLFVQDFSVSSRESCNVWQNPTKIFQRSGTEMRKFYTSVDPITLCNPDVFIQTLTWLPLMNTVSAKASDWWLMKSPNPYFINNISWDRTIAPSINQRKINACRRTASHHTFRLFKYFSLVQTSTWFSSRYRVHHTLSVHLLCWLLSITAWRKRDATGHLSLRQSHLS